MESIEKIKSTYSRIAEEAQQESNKIQQAIYHTGSLRLLLFVAGIAGIIYFREESWTILAGIALVTLLPFILLIKYHNNLFRRKDYQEKRAEVNRQELAALDYDTSCFDAGEEFVDPAHCMPTIWTYSAHIHCSSTSTAPAPNWENTCWQTGWDSISKRKRIYWNDRQPYANWLPNCNSASTSASSACCTKAQQPTKPN